MDEDYDKISAAKELLKKNLTNTHFRGYKEQKLQIYNVIIRTIKNAESDSLLIVGPRGCGKTSLINTCLKDLKDEPGCFDNYIVIQLNGFVHTDDNLALKDIIQQLHIAELEGDRVSGSFSDNLYFVLNSLKAGNRQTSKAIIIILDEFQLFCGHRNQTLLYNLFDVAQSAQAPICVIGITTRIDITELLEKRVKSRFSHRQIMLYPNNDIGERLVTIVDYLCLPEESKSLHSPLDKHFARKWNDGILAIFKLPKIILSVKRLLDLDPNERNLKNLLFLVITKISKDNPFIIEDNVEEVFRNYGDRRVQLLKDLSVLEFCLVIAMSHHHDIYDGEPFNFEMIYKRYIKFANQNSSAQITQKQILLKAFERLADLELIMSISCGSKVFKKEYQLYNLFVTNHQVKEAANSYVGLPTDVAQWASSSIFSI